MELLTAFVFLCIGSSMGSFLSDYPSSVASSSSLGIAVGLGVIVLSLNFILRSASKEETGFHSLSELLEKQTE